MSSTPEIVDFSFESEFDRAEGDRDWHANFTSPRTDHFAEIDIRVELRGENTFRFNPYSVKTFLQAHGRHFSFSFKDWGDTPFDGEGREIRLFCTIKYPV